MGPIDRHAMIELIQESAGLDTYQEAQEAVDAFEECLSPQPVAKKVLLCGAHIGKSDLARAMKAAVCCSHTPCYKGKGDRVRRRQQWNIGGKR